jgi:drug/metabolite transporter (DMT)-like permease
MSSSASGRAAENRPLLAITRRFGATFAFVAMQAVVKLARMRGFAASEVMFYRTAPGLPLLWWILRRRGQGLAPEQPGNLLVRSLFGSVAMSTNFTSMRWLSLAQFSTLGLMQPVFVALASPLLLREHVRSKVWQAMACAFVGALIMLAPALEAHDLPWLAALLGLTSALASAFAHIWVRKATAQDPVERVVFHFAAWVSVGSLAFGLLRGGFQGAPLGVSALEMGLLILGMSAFGTLGQVLMTRAHVFGEAATVSLVGYSNIALSMAMDLALWRILPAPSAVAGALFMVGAGVLLVRGERGGAAQATERT